MRRTQSFAVVALAIVCGLPAASLAQEAPAGEQPAEAAAKPAEKPADASVTPPAVQSLSKLLSLVQKGWRQEEKDNREREARFKQDRANQVTLLAQAKATLGQEEARSQALEFRFEENEVTLAELEKLLADRLGTLGELFGVVRQVAGDASGNIESSLVSAEVTGRTEFLTELGKARTLPSIESLEGLWYELQREMTEQGRVSKFKAPVLNTDGDEVERDVIRAGPFAAVAGGNYILWEPSIGKLRELDRQPPARYRNTVGPFEATTSGVAPLAVDPSRGSLLSLLIQTPSAEERIQQGGAVGYVIIVLGLLALVLGVIRWAMITVAGRRVAAQRKSDRANSGNPLGRVLGVYEANPEADAETLELRLDEAVMRESSKLERFLWLVKVVSVVAPLLGLLGTVTGMIQTFQAITLFGAGDPKMMAGGISEALITTMLGLSVAIPLVLLHAAVASSTKRITDVLDEQSAGLIASRAEQAHA